MELYYVDNVTNNVTVAIYIKKTYHMYHNILLRSLLSILSSFQDS